MDKRPQLELHRRLARRGVLLEYDTFLNPKYSPDTGVWPLLQQMVSDGLDGQICVGTDMARPTAWARLGGSPGLCALGTQVIPRMRALGFAPPVIARLTGGNILARLVQR
jgi:predicted metal-dependent phosphotriesterase family hydrolase